MASRTLYSLCGTDQARPFSPHCWKAVLSLAHKGLDFEERPLAFTAIPGVENGFSKTVPILRDGDELVKDSFEIALYLDEAYPDLPSLFNGEGGKALARFVESWSQTQLHPSIVKIAVLDIHDMLDEADRTYFRDSRKAFFGKTIEEIAANREEEIAAFPAKLEPIRRMLGYQSFLGGDAPLFADYIVFGALQWARVTSKADLFKSEDPVRQWFERCLDLHGAKGRSVTAA
ncbi:glutathione S-transferase family protein [Agrobacterium larrymoorei]|uniref:Glutathione S-transferase family protein n=1 Tax=Agrobacterium larrymoorei TaxID=160699 RepID=A0AAF0KD21_9HYPH|nr:glutathione S-transferase family protein [Agrobacterium larrymoorei]WHA40241.1 glutathione S-transferase family protein [Agrobacterium larrymoorei]